MRIISPLKIVRTFCNMCAVQLEKMQPSGGVVFTEFENKICFNYSEKNI